MEVHQTKREEFWNALTHGIALVMAVLGVLLLFWKADLQNQNLKIGLFLYASSLILLYAASSAYHYVDQESLKRKLRILDHISIYFLIAGTYSPVVLTLLKNENGILLFYSVWGFAFAGTVLKLFFTGRFENISLVLYVLMGCLIAVDALAVLSLFSVIEIAMLGLGGLFYIAGIYFYVKTSIPFNHVIWHVFVMLGSISHFLMIYFAVLRI